MPRGHGGIVGAPRRCLPLPYRVIYQATLLPPTPFFMQVTKTHSHMIISTHLPIGFGGHLAPVHSSLFSHLVCLVFPLPPLVPHNFTFSHHAHLAFVVF